MRIEFRTTRLKQICEIFRLGSREWGDQVARKVVQRLNELASASSLSVMSRLAPGARAHPLKGSFSGQCAVRLHGGYRLRLRPANPPEEYETPAGADLTKITAIEILEVEDYHG